MNPNGSPVPAAAASTGFVGALTVIFTWGLSIAKVQVPPEVAAAIMMLLTPVVHILAVRWGLDPSNPTASQAAMPLAPVTPAATPTPAAAQP